MIVYSNSWHYRLNRIVKQSGTCIPDNSCGYFWFTVFNILKVLVIFAASVLILSLMFADLTRGILPIDGALLYVASFFLGLIISSATIVLLFLLVGLIVYIKEFIEEKRANSTTEKSDGVIRQFIKDKRNKYCSTITFIQQDEDK